MTIKTILKTSYPAVRALMLGSNDFVSPDLLRAVAEGRLMTLSLGPCLINAETGAHCEPIEIVVPMSWDAEDDALPQMEKIHLVKGLIDNTVQCHDDLLLEKLGAGKAAVSREYRYDLRTFGEKYALYTAVTVLR